MVAVVSGGNVDPKQAAAILGGDESRTSIPSTSSHGDVLLRKHVPDALDEARAARRDLLAVPPVLHGQAEAHGHRRPRRALPAPPRARRQPGAPRLALAESWHNDRRTGGPRGRDDARPGNWAVAVRTPRRRDRAGLAADRLGDGAPPRVPAAGRPRRDGARRVARDRLPRARHLGELRGAGGRARTARRSTPSSRAARSSSPSRSRSASPCCSSRSGRR